MEYIYGSVQRNGETVENLKTVGEVHSDLSGKVETRREYPDSTIVDSCIIKEKYHSAKDVAGNCYDWYAISGHYRYVDKGAEMELAQQSITELELNDIEQGQAITDLELQILGVQNNV